MSGAGPLFDTPNLLRGSEIEKNKIPTMDPGNEVGIGFRGSGFGGSNTAVVENLTRIVSSSLSGGNNGTDDDLFPDLPEGLTRFATGCCLLFILVGIPGNLLTIIALARCKKVRNATAYFIINLSLCDLMFCCFNLPLAMSMFWNRRWIHGETVCVLFPFFRYGLMAVSIFTVLAITINRYVMIGHPRLYPRMYRTRHLALMIFLIWLGAFGAVTPTLFGVWGKFELDRSIASCSIVNDVYGRSPKIVLFLVAFLLPCLAIIICYARIFFIVRNATLNSRPGAGSSTMGSNKGIKNQKEIDSPEQEMLKRPHTEVGRPSMAVIHQRGKMTTKDRKLLWMILVIFGTFFLCYCPITVVKSVAKKSNNYWNIAGYILIYLSTCINPIIYVVMSSEYRQAYKSIILCKRDWALSSRSHFQSASFHQSQSKRNSSQIQSDKTSG